MVRKTLKKRHNRKSVAKKHPPKGTRKSGRKSKKQMPKNSYFSLMLNAKKRNLPSFVYKGKTFKKKTGKGNKSHLVFYSSH